jgi:hypothetical protein
MKVREPLQYNVVQGERIDLLIHSRHLVLPIVVAALDGQILSSEEQGRFSFIITKPTGLAHSIDLSFDFPPDSAPDASYEVELTSSLGGELDSFSIERSSSLRNLVLVFQVNGDTGPK